MDYAEDEEPLFADDLEGLSEDEDIPPLPPPMESLENASERASLHRAATSDPNAGDAGTGTAPPVKKQRKILTLTQERVFSEKGLPYLSKEFPELKFKGKGNEVVDLDKLMQHYEHWANRLFPKMTFVDVTNRIESLAKTKEFKSDLREMRRRLIRGPSPTLVEDDEDDQRVNIAGNQGDDERADSRDLVTGDGVKSDDSESGDSSIWRTHLTAQRVGDENNEIWRKFEECLTRDDIPPYAIDPIDQEGLDSAGNNWKLQLSSDDLGGPDDSTGEVYRSNELKLSFHAQSTSGTSSKQSTSGTSSKQSTSGTSSKQSTSGISSKHVNNASQDKMTLGSDDAKASHNGFIHPTGNSLKLAFDSDDKGAFVDGSAENTWKLAYNSDDQRASVNKTKDCAVGDSLKLALNSDHSSASDDRNTHSVGESLKLAFNSDNAIASDDRSMHPIGESLKLAFNSDNAMASDDRSMHPFGESLKLAFNSDDTKAFEKIGIANSNSDIWKLPLSPQTHAIHKSTGDCKTNRYDDSEGEENLKLALDSDGSGQLAGNCDTDDGNGLPQDGTIAKLVKRVPGKKLHQMSSGDEESDDELRLCIDDDQ